MPNPAHAGVRALGYLGLGVSDLDRWRTFASEILGLATTGDQPDGTVRLRMDDRRYRIALHSSPLDDLLYVGWEVADAAVLREIAEVVSAAGYGVRIGDAAACEQRGVAGLAVCDGPSGVRTEFFWGPQLEEREPFRSPRGLDGFVTGDAGLGHIVLDVDDVDAALHFYCDLLGFRLSDFVDFERVPGTKTRLTFLHCNPRHHSIAFVRASTPRRRLSHIMLELKSLDDVGRTFSLCERENVPISISLGRHTNDEMLSFYIVTPSGFNVEYGYGGRLIDDTAWQVATYDIGSIWGHRRMIDHRTAPSDQFQKGQTV